MGKTPSGHTSKPTPRPVSDAGEVVVKGSGRTRELTFEAEYKGPLASDRVSLKACCICEFRAVEVAETKDLDENTILDLNRSGNNCGITIEHASERTNIPKFSYEQITASPAA